MTKHPLLQSTSNRIILVVAFVFASMIVFGVIGSYRESREITACKVAGGTPIYRTKTQEVPADDRGTTGFALKYQVFARCQPAS